MDIEFGFFVWDSQKEAINLSKHGIDFWTASRAFLDPRRRFLTDAKHSRDEVRLFCIGKVAERIVTVRFTMRDDRIRIIGAGYWRGGRRHYHEK